MATNQPSSPQMHSFQVSVDGESVTIVFKSLKTGLKVAKQLQQAFPLTKETREQEHDGLVRYIRTVSSFSLNQPQFVDVYSNQLDHQIAIPGTTMARTLSAAADHANVTEILSIQKQKQAQAQQQQIQSGVGAPAQRAIPPPTQSSGMSQTEQIYRLIYQILIQVFSKEPSLLMQASMQTGIRLDKGDPQQLSTLVKAMTQRLMRFPTHQMLEKLQEFQNIPPEMKEKIQELVNQSSQQNSVQRPPNIPLPQLPQFQPPPQPRREQTSQNSQMHAAAAQKQDITPTRIQLASQVMSQLEPSKISQLIHGPVPNSLCKTHSYSKADVNTMRFSAQGREQAMPPNLMQSVLQSWSAQALKSKQQPANESDLSAKILKLFEKQADFHSKSVNVHELKRFHKNFSFEENFLLMVKVREQLSPSEPAGWTTITNAAVGAVQLQVLDSLQKLVEQHKNNPGTGAALQQMMRPTPAPVATSAPAPAPAPAQTPVPVQPKPQLVAAKVENVAPAPSPQLNPEFQQQVRQIFVKLINSVDPTVISKAILMIIGLGNNCQLQQSATHVFFEAGLMSVAKSSTFDTSQEKLFIIVTGLVPDVLKVMIGKVEGKGLQYKVNAENLPTFDQFYEEYIKQVQFINSQQQDRAKLMKESNFPLFLESDIQQMLCQSSEKIALAVAQRIGISSIIKKEEPELKQKVGQQIRSAFGVERSETDSEDM